MAKLMSPNIRIDWYPDGHFADPANPTVDELNSGYNLSRAIVTGFTLDFTDPVTEEYSGVLSDFTISVYSRDGYNANLQFFLAPRGSVANNERAFRHAEELFYNENQVVGYFVKRFGYGVDVLYGDIDAQHVDIFKVQADIPKVLSEDGEPILLEIRFIPQGFAGSAVVAPWQPPVNTYVWEDLPGQSMSLYYNEDREITKRNVLVNPSLEYENLSFLSIPNNYYTAARSSQGIFGNWALELTVSRMDTYPQQFHMMPVDTNVMQGKWVGFSYVVKSSAEGLIETHLYGSEGVDLITDKVLSTEYRRARSGAVFIPHGANSIWLTTSIYSNYEGRKSDIPVGTKIHFDGLQLVVGDSEESVLRQLDTYFDGDGEHTVLPPEAVDYDPPKDQYFWYFEPGNSESGYYDSSGRITKRNYILDPSFEHAPLGNSNSNSGMYWSFFSTAEIRVDLTTLYGDRALYLVSEPDDSTSTPPQVHFRPQNLSDLQGYYVGGAVNIKLPSNSGGRIYMYSAYGSTRPSEVNKKLSGDFVCVKLPPALIPNNGTNIRIVLMLYNSDGTFLSSGEEVIIDGVVMVRGVSEADVERQLETFFDGDGAQPWAPPAEDFISE